MLCPYGDHVFAGADEFGNVIGEAGVAVGVEAQIIAVHPNLRVLVHPLEGEAHPPALCILVKHKMLPIPGRAAGQIARAAGVAFVEGMLHRPVVGQGHASPPAVVKAHKIRVRHVAQVKPPIQIQFLPNAHKRLP